MNAVLVPLLLTGVVVLEGETAVGGLLNTFAANILEWVSESSADELESDRTSGSKKEDNNRDTKEKSAEKYATACNVVE